MMTGIDHLHPETKILNIQQSMEMFCKQYLVAALSPDHPAYREVSREPDPRGLKATIQSKYLEEVNQLVVEGDNPESIKRKKIQLIHNQAVIAAKKIMPVNALWGSE